MPFRSMPRIGALACVEMKMIGKPYVGELQVRFDDKSFKRWKITYNALSLEELHSEQQLGGISQTALGTGRFWKGAPRLIANVIGAMTGLRCNRTRQKACHSVQDLICLNPWREVRNREHWDLDGRRFALLEGKNQRIRQQCIQLVCWHSCCSLTFTEEAKGGNTLCKIY
jgi:hypothetical protein